MGTLSAAGGKRNTEAKLQMQKSNMRLSKEPDFSQIFTKDIDTFLQEREWEAGSIGA